jgi:hypothetical protein
MQHFYQCGCCDGTLCTAIITCNDDEVPDSDDLQCLRRVLCIKPVWKKMEAV